jgi:hypothetical protein
MPVHHMCLHGFMRSGKLAPLVGASIVSWLIPRTKFGPKWSADFIQTGSKRSWI